MNTLSRQNGPSGPEKYHLPAPAKESSVLHEDLGTPDNHVPRDPRLIRLTGTHPFNAEAPLSELYNEGFITSKNLHYVRNHGPVFRVADEEIDGWTFTVEGMVKEKKEMTLTELLNDFEQVTYPVTLVCAGNRRKEQNIVRNTNGFSWGAAGLSTALWTGVPISKLLARCCPLPDAKYVCFEGAEKLLKDCYGTCIKLNWALDPNRGVLVAHRMNGEALPPDHDRPLRIIVPGQIGGRSVKWLKKIIVTDKPSDNWYHVNDNRVLPTMITPEESANMPDTWKDERYAIYDLNVNSVICYPAHDEKLLLSEATGSYKIRGYAYGGGGRRVTRVEVTLNKGRSWTLATIDYPEDKFRLAPYSEMLYGGRMDMSWRETSFCWCFWELDVAVEDLSNAADIVVRAMDEGMMVQPRDMYWSVLGMMNNPWFRVVIHKEENMLRFEHPALPGTGGWMEQVKKAGRNITNGYWGESLGTEQDVVVPVEKICMTNPEAKREISIDELRQHNSKLETEPWFVVNGQVYDATKVLQSHPGGPNSIIEAAGKDASKKFLEIHSDTTKRDLSKYHIGSLDDRSKTELADDNTDKNTEGDEGNKSREVFLRADAWSKARLVAKTLVSHDTQIFRFALDCAAQRIGLPVGQHVRLRLYDATTSQNISRPYTPLPEGNDRSTLELLIKIYHATPERKGGQMTEALHVLPLGHFVDFKGPFGKFQYLGRGRCVISGQNRNVDRFVMVCGGSGITPIFQVLHAVLNDRDDSTKCLVLDGNHSEDDILCRAELDALAARCTGRFRILYTLSRPGDRWTGLKGRMDQTFFEREVGPCGKVGGETLVLICGPKPLEESVKKIFEGLGWKDEDLIFF